MDTNHDGTVDAGESRAYAGSRCAAVAADVVATVAGHRLVFAVDTADFGYHSGAAGLHTSRLECTLVAPARGGPPVRAQVPRGWRALGGHGRRGARTYSLRPER